MTPSLYTLKNHHPRTIHVCLIGHIEHYSFFHILDTAIYSELWGIPFYRGKPITAPRLPNLFSHSHVC